MKPKKKIVITGGPGSGKTSVINKLKELNFHCFDEISRDFIDLGKRNGKDHFFKEEPQTFSQFLWNGRLRQYQESEQIESLNNIDPWLFFDRGLPDVVAYLNFMNHPMENWESELKDYPYDLIFLIPPEKSIYQQDKQRMESFEESTEIHRALQQTYHPLGHCIEVPFLSIDERVSFVLEKCETLNIKP